MNTDTTIKKEGFSIKYVVLFAICFLAAGFFSSRLSGSNMLYSGVKTPPLSPPAILFPIAWSVLYVLIGGTAGAVYSYRNDDESDNIRKAVLWTFVGMFFNLLWSPLFFGKEEFLASLINIGLMIVLNIVVFMYYYRIKKTFAFLIIPYIVWLCFAFYLNAGILVLN